MTTYSLFVTCPRGLEAPLFQELEQLKCQDIRAVDGGVACKGGMEQVYRINLHSRTASRVLLRLTKSGYRNEQDIYKAAKNIRWTDWFDLEQTFKVKVEGKRAQVKSLDFVGLKMRFNGNRWQGFRLFFVSNGIANVRFTYANQRHNVASKCLVKLFAVQPAVAKYFLDSC